MDLLFMILFVGSGMKLFHWIVFGRKWNHYYIHTCGNREEYFHLDVYGRPCLPYTVYGRPCNKCGKEFDSRDWTKVVMREKFPFIWERAKE